MLKQLKDSMPQTYVFLLKMIPRLRLSVVFSFPENMLFTERKEEDTATNIHLNHVSGAETRNCTYCRCISGLFIELVIVLCILRHGKCDLLSHCSYLIFGRKIYGTDFRFSIYIFFVFRTMEILQ